MHGRTPTVDPDVLRRAMDAMCRIPDRQGASVEEIAAAIDRMETARLKKERGL